MHILKIIPFVLTFFVLGCASVPKADVEVSNKVKQVSAPSAGNAGIYVYRSNNIIGSALKKDIWIDGECLGESARGVFFFKEVVGDKEHTISTESEFSPNHLKLITNSGKNYFIQQFIKPGVLVGGADLKEVDEIDAKEVIAQYDLAINGTCSKNTISELN